MKPCRISAAAVLAAVAAVAALAGSASAANCTLDGHPMLVKKTSCATGAQIIHAFDTERTHVPGWQHMVDSQLPFKVRGWRCGGLQGHILCIKGNWTSAVPPRGRPLIDWMYMA